MILLLDGIHYYMHGGSKVNFLRRFFANMYGMDKLGYFTVILSIIFTLTGNIFKIRLPILLSEVLFLYSIFRFISHNKGARYQENQKFIKFYDKFQLSVHQAKSRAKDKKNNYYKCPKCKTYLSVPKGVGKVMIVCVKCKHQFVKKSR